MAQGRIENATSAEMSFEGNRHSDPPAGRIMFATERCGCKNFDRRVMQHVVLFRLIIEILDPLHQRVIGPGDGYPVTRGHVARVGHPMHPAQIMKAHGTMERSCKPPIISCKPGARTDGQAQGIHQFRRNLVIGNHRNNQIIQPRLGE